MKMYLDTSTDQCTLKLDDNVYTWLAMHDLAEQISTFIHDKLEENNADWQDISEIVFFAGPGSFTGLRIGAAVVNTLADQLKIPLYNHRGEQCQVIIPDYGRPANVTAPKK